MCLRQKLVVLCSLACCLIGPPDLFAAEQHVSLKGRVIDEASGKPIPGIEVGVVRATALGGKGPRSRVKPERVAVADDEGRFEFSVPITMPGLRDVFAFTCAKDRVNLIHPDVKFGTPTPTARDLRHSEMARLDLTHGVTGINFCLPPPPTIMRDVMVSMRDGTKLATDVYLPAGKHPPLPALLYRTPYNKASRGLPFSQLDKGYAVVWQDFRGRFGSEGETDLPFLPDAWGKQQDGYDAIEWAASQPWCNGKVATLGASAGGITQVMTAGSAPPHLVCQSIAVACGSMYHHAVFQGGAFRRATVQGWLKNNKFSPECLRLFLDHPLYDDLWRSVDASTRSAEINVPGTFIGGWYDLFCQGTIDAFLWRQHQGGPGARGKQKLLMGPWVHGRSRKIGEFMLPEQAVRPPPETSPTAWLDYWLKGVGNGVVNGPAVAYYIMGAFDEPGAPGHEWRHLDVWPVPSTTTPFYLHADGRLRKSEPPSSGESRSYRYDPEDPVPTLGGCNLILARGPFDQRRIEDRPDVLLYTSEPLAEPIEVTGRIKMVLFASSSCRDTDFTAKLTDVYPDGKSVLIQDGIIRARYRNSFEREELLAPGKVYRFEIDLWSTSIIFNRGHRLRVAISSSNAPRFEPNPNTGDPFRANDRTVIARNSVYHDAEHPSHLLLPVVARIR